MKTKHLVSIVTISLSTYVLCGLITLIICVLTWGKGQAMPVASIEKRVHLGMSLDAVEYALGESPGSLTKHVTKIETRASDNFTYYVPITESGVGSLFVPQKNITLYLDRNRRVCGGIVKTVCGVDDESARLELTSL